MKSTKIILTIFCTLLATSLYAQKLSLGYLLPGGGQVGTTVEIEAGGLNINKATKVLFSHPGIKGELQPIEESVTAKRKRRRLNDQSSPQLADRIKIIVTVAPTVPCGLYDLRLQGPKGVSNMLPFEVASYPNYMEADKSSLNKPNKVENLPSVLCGYVAPGGVDYFQFSGEKGDTIVAAVKARQLVPYIADAVPGWFQPVIKIVDSRGREIAYSDDYHHHVDPVIITTLPKSGKYKLMIHDAIYRGRKDFNYRIHLGKIPFVTGRYPAYGVVGKKVKQHMEGVNLGTSKASVKVKKEGYHYITFTNNIGTSNAVSFYALPKGRKLVQSPKAGAELTFRNAISDSLTKESHIKQYKIYTEAKQPVIVELIGRRNDSRIDAVLRLRNKSGKVIAQVDDTEDPIQGLMTFHADPILKYTPSRSGELTLEVEDLHRGYGKDYHYLLVRHAQMPSFNAFVSPANITIPSGGTSLFRVDITGRLKRPAHLVVEGLPKGYTTSSTKIRQGRRFEVSVTAPKGAPVKRFPIEVKLNYPGADGVREQADVLPVDNMMQAFYYTHHIPAAELALDVTEPSPYRVSVDFDIEKPIEFKPTDTSIPIKVTIDRSAGFDEPVDIEMGKKVRLFFIEPVTFMPGEKEKVVNIQIDPTMMEKLMKRKGNPSWQMYMSCIVKGEWVKQGKGRQVQLAKYSEMTPIFELKLNKK